MTKSSIGGVDRSVGLRQPQTESRSDSKSKSKIKEKPSVKTQKLKAPKPMGAPKGVAHAGEAHDDAVAEPGLGGVEGRDGPEGAHRRGGPEAHELEQEEEIEEHEALHESGATGADSIKRKGGDASGGDGFEGESDQREAYERYLRGTVRDDQERIRGLRERGKKDDFIAERPPREVESFGPQRAAAHVVRLYEGWTLEGVSREDAIARAATFLAGFQGTQSIRRVLAELESKPIRDVYPLEVLLKMLTERPELLPGVRAGAVLGNVEELAVPGRVIAGRPTTLQVPVDVRLKSFALLGGGRPGYEFHPHPEEGRYSLLVDTPGRWRFAILAAPLQQLGRIQRETADALLEIFDVHVSAMGKKGEPMSPEAWHALQREEAADAGDDDDEEDEEESRDDVRAALLVLQIREQLQHIVRDPETPATTAATYSWDATFFRPGTPLDAEPILHIVVTSAGPFDPAWGKAKDAIALKQREHEPGRALLSAEDVAAALRRARVR